MYKYEVIIYWSAELPGCGAHGSTPNEGLTQSQEAIGPWIETAREFGDSVPEPKGRRLMFA